MKKFWRSELEEAKQFKAEHPKMIVTLEYDAPVDGDFFTFFDNIDEFDLYKARYNNPYKYRGWITTYFGDFGRA